MRSAVSTAVFKKELSSYFKSPLGYVFIVIFLFGLGYLAFEPGSGSFFYMREASMRAMFRYMPWMLLFLVPAVSMKLWAEERRSGTIELLFTMPITVKQAVIAKFLASWSFITICLFGTLPMVFTVIYLGNPDLGAIFTGYLASILMSGMMLAVGSFFSALTKNQVVSFILTVVVCALLLSAGSPPVLDFLNFFSPKYVVELFESLSVLNHFESIEKGVFSLSNLWFFSVLIIFWLFASTILLTENKAN